MLIRGGSRTSNRGGGGHHDCQRHEFSIGGLGPQKFLKIGVSEMAIPAFETNFVLI